MTHGPVYVRRIFGPPPAVPEFRGASGTVREERMQGRVDLRDAKTSSLLAASLALPNRDIACRGRTRREEQHSHQEDEQSRMPKRASQGRVPTAERDDVASKVVKRLHLLPS
jgi:hypothetical protein